MVLSHFVRLPKNARVLDLGSGCGTLGLLLCAVNEGCRVTGVELSQGCPPRRPRQHPPQRSDEPAWKVYAPMCGKFPAAFPAGSFDVCISNPPYFSGGPASRTAALARREDACSPADLFGAAAWTLKYGGDFFLVHRPERLAELIIRGSEVNLEAKRLCLVRHRADSPVNLVLLQLRKGGKPES